MSVKSDTEQTSGEAVAPASDWVDDRDLAAEGGRLTPLSRVWWQQLRARGEGPRYYRVGGRRILYRWSEVQAWLAARPMGGDR